jgi:agmatine deiminase
MTNLAPEHHLPPAAGSTTWQMPAEWAPHERCLMAWPTRESLWDPYFEEAKAEYAATANAIGQFEPVLMITNPGQAREVRAACGGAVEVVELAIDDSWIRDSGPLIVADRTGRLAGVDFGFNSWGERFLPYDQDATISRRILEVLGIERMPSDTIMEGGSITVDGEGTLITTEQCLLNVNRNPAMSRADIEAELNGRLGVSKVIWLPYGHHDDAHTDGHVDGVCTYVRPGVVIAQTCKDPELPDYERMAANVKVLRESSDAAGRPFEILELPEFPVTTLPDGTTTMVAYANFYLANGGVIVPIAAHELDEQALATLRRAFPDREVVGVPGNIVAYGGGGVHCITQQIPRPNSAAAVGER